MIPRGAATLTFCAALLFGAAARAQEGAGAKPRPERARYRIQLALDFDARTYTGEQTVRWVNRDARPASALYFHLYPNLRPAPAAPAADDSDEPRLEVTTVETIEGVRRPLAFALEDGGATLRVHLREPIAPGGAVEVRMEFRGSVPAVGADETSLPAHVVQQVGAALRDTREVRRARDINFVARGVMLLGSFYPVLAARDGGEWQRRAELSVGDHLFADPADYEVSLQTRQRLGVFASGGEPAHDLAAGAAHTFRAGGLRQFALVAGPTLRASSRTVGGVRVSSVYTSEHEKVGRRVLDVAAEAVRVFAGRFGPLPFDAVTVAEAPLVAGHGSAEFSGLAVIASAFYLDFDSPAVRNLPEIVREQRASVEESLEFAAAQGVARQWWGAAVGHDPSRRPVVGEGLSHWSALLYVREAHGEERARAALDDQLRGVYQIYRTFGGEDMPADRPAREYRNSFQYAAVVVGKGALMLVALEELLGAERFFRALRGYYEANRFEVAEPEDLRAAFVAEAELSQRRAVTRAFGRWLSERRGDEDIGPPNPQLADALGLPAGAPQQPRDRNAFSRLGRFFWRQMTRIR